VPQLTIVPHGESAAVVLSAALLESIGLNVGDVVDVTLGNRQLILRPVEDAVRLQKIKEVTQEVFERRVDAYQGLASRGESSHSKRPAHIVVDLDAWSYLWDRENQAYILLQLTEESANPLDQSLIFDLYTNTIFLMEDNELAALLKERMRMEGIPVFRQGDLPPFVSPIVQVRDDFAEGLITMDEANRRLNSLRNDAEARRDWVKRNRVSGRVE
jgi:antitoxin component of MazEF toxin-antitoxin module